MPSRRAYLASSASVLVALAGCNDATGGPETDTATSTRRTTTTTRSTMTTESTTTAEDPITELRELSWGEPATVDGTDVTPARAAVRQSVFYRTSPDSVGVLSLEDRQAVFVTVEIDGDTHPDPGDFVLSAGDTAAGWTEYGRVRGIRLADRMQPYTLVEDGTGWVGFDVPDHVTDDSPRLRLQPGGESNGAIGWPFPGDVVAALQSPPPEFAVTEFDAPEAVSPSEPVPVTATVENRGDGAGTFRAAFNELGPDYYPNQIELHVEPGESKTWEGVADSHVGDEDAEVVRFDFRSPGGIYEREVEITDT